MTEQPRAQLAVAEALEHVLPTEDSGEQGEVGGGRGVEGTRRPAVAIPQWLHEAVEA